MYIIDMKSLQIPPEKEKALIQAAQAGDLEAFNLLILHYQNLLFGIALRLLNDEDSAGDAVQEALISAFCKFNTFRGDSLRSWLARVVVNACYDEVRKEKRQRSVPLEQFNPEGEEIETSYWLVDPDANPEIQFEILRIGKCFAKKHFPAPADVPDDIGVGGCRRIIVRRSRQCDAHSHRDSEKPLGTGAFADAKFVTIFCRIVACLLPDGVIFLSVNLKQVTKKKLREP